MGLITCLISLECLACTISFLLSEATACIIDLIYPTATAPPGGIPLPEL